MMNVTTMQKAQVTSTATTWPVITRPPFSQTVLVDHTGNPYTLTFLAQLLDIPSTRILHEFDANSAIDIELRLGSDAQTVSIP